MLRWAIFAPLALFAAVKQFDPAAVNQPTQETLVFRAKGPAVVRAQILLARAHFSCGEIDGAFGTNLQKALNAFQEARKLPVSTGADAATWAALNADTAPALVEYTLTEEDLKGPFTPIPKRLEDQAALTSLGYTSAMEALGEHFHTSPALLKRLNPAANFGQVGTRILAPNVLVMPPARADRIVVSKSESAVRAYDATGELLAFYGATIGSRHDPLPVGEWKINGVARNPKFHYNPELFWDAKPASDKATLQSGPNNPVGVVWIDLSKDHYGIHGTPEPGKVGHAESHGCIRLTNWDALELAAMVKPGTPATLKE
ncbi:MAG: L,D-transpeptidase [Candidatus Solibacter sp.]